MKILHLFILGLSLGFCSIWFLRSPNPRTHKNDTPHLLSIDNDIVSESDIYSELTYDLKDIPLSDFDKQSLKSLEDEKIQEVMIRKTLAKSIKKNLATHESDAFFRTCEQEWKQKFKDETPTNVRDLLKERYCEYKVIQTHLSSLIEPKSKISEQQIIDYYNDNLQEFQSSPRVLLRHILVNDEQTARRITSRVNKKNFAELAKKFSTAPESETGGLLGPFTQGELPSAMNLSFQMKPGEISNILSSPYGFHIVLLEKKLPAGVLPLEEVRNQIRETLIEAEREKEFRKLLHSSLQSTKIETKTSDSKPNTSLQRG